MMVKKEASLATAALVHFLYFARRITLAVVCVCLAAQPILQLSVLLIVNIFCACIQLHVKPLKARSRNISVSYDDISIVIVIDIMFCFTDLLYIASMRYAAGFILIIVTLLNTFVNLILLSIQPVRKLVHFVKYYYLLNKRYPGVLKSRCKHKLCSCCTKTNGTTNREKKSSVSEHTSCSTPHAIKAKREVEPRHDV